MIKNRIQLIHKFLTIISYIFIFISVITSPHFEKAEPNPYFQFNNTPLAYWIGISISIIASLLSVFPRQEGSSSRAFGLSALFSLTIYTNVIPRLMYKNKIWLDLYPYVAEVAYILFYGHPGPYKAATTPGGFKVPQTPGPSIFSSQYALTTGLDYSLVTVLISFLFPIIMVIGVYLFARMFVKWRAALLAVLVYIGLYHFGFYYCRGDLSVALLPFILYCMMKLFLTRKRSWYAIISLFYVVLVLSHPFYSFYIILTMVAPFLLIKVRGYVFKLINRIDYQENLGNYFIDKSQLGLKSITYFLIWGFWYLIYTYSKFMVGRIRSKLQFLSPNPAGIISATRYTSQYHPLVRLSFYELLFGTIIGFFLTLFYIFKKKSEWKTLIISSWLMSILFFIGSLFILNMSGYTNRLFRIYFPILGILIGKFLTETFSNVRKKKLITITKSMLLGIILSFIILLPFTEYPHMAFVYPSTAYLREVDYLTMRARGLVITIGGHEEFTYYILKNNASAHFLYGKMSLDRAVMTNSSMLLSYNITAVVYRAYAKDGYLTFQPSMTQLIQQFQERLTMDTNLQFAKIYHVNGWNFAYSKQ